MKLSLTFLLCIVLNFCVAQVQNDTVTQIIVTTFYSKKVYSKVFYDYEVRVGKNDFSKLPAGKYALILPDSIIKKHYPGIDNDLSYSLMTSGLFFSLYVAKQERGSILISSHYIDQNMRVLILFDEIYVGRDCAKVVFHTTSSLRTKQVDKYYRFYCELQRNKKGQWTLRKVKRKDIPCCNDAFFGY